MANDLETLHELNSNYVRAVQESDVGWFDRNLTPDFLNTNPDGSLVDRAGFLDQVGRPVAIANLQAEDVIIRVLGDVAIIHARTTYTKAEGHGGAGRYTDIWHRKGARWLCVAAHVTRG